MPTIKCSLIAADRSEISRSFGLDVEHISGMVNANDYHTLRMSLIKYRPRDCVTRCRTSYLIDSTPPTTFFTNAHGKVAGLRNFRASATFEALADRIDATVACNLCDFGDVSPITINHSKIWSLTPVQFVGTRGITWETARRRDEKIMSRDLSRTSSNS